MLAKLQSLIQSKLESDTTDATDKEDALHLAAASLLIEISAADFVEHPEERNAIFSALASVFKLEEATVNELVDLATRASQNATSVHEFTSVINSSCSHEEKRYLLEQLWRVAFADGELDKYEDYYIRKLADLLYLSHKDFIQTKHAAESTG